jgi:glutamine synthetase
MIGLPDGVRWVTLTFVDVFGLGHAVSLPAERFGLAVERGEPIDGSVLEGRARRLETDMLLVPDPATVCHTGGDLARAVCNVVTLDGSPWGADPRTTLQKVEEQAGDVAAGWAASAELELYLIDAAGHPIDRGGYFDESEGLGISVVREAAARLGECGVEVAACHLEVGPGQYEIDLAPRSALRLADGLVLAKRLLRELAAERGLRATFMARPFHGEAGSGLHLQQRSGLLLDDNGKLTPAGGAYVAGPLTHARGLSALAAPNINSYKRLHSGPEAPGAGVWAHTNRAALVRVSSYLGETASIEYRGADPSANPYLLLAGLLIAGGHGIDEELELPPPIEEDLEGFDPAASDSVRFEPLPRNLDDALDALMADDVLVDAFDHQLVSRLVDGRRAEVEEYRGLVTDWERDRYLDEP